ncbi:MAG: glycosyltransferase family 39 protein [Planctomycetaceae bacterium]|nr:glycosyltransferase family 39 protein [Planctomycetaceae bacterium]
MLQSGDWIIPRYGDVPRVQKPPLVYWLVATSAWLFGEFHEFAVRLPSALAALGLVALMGVWAARWYGREAAFGAALVQTTSLWAMNYGRHVEIDMVLCLLTTAAMFLIATQPTDEPPSRARWRWTGILTLIAVTWLAKFHYGSAMVFGPVFVFWVVQRHWRGWLNLVNPVGVLVLAAGALIWPCLLLREYPEALERIRVETVGRATGEMGGGVWWFYGPQLLVLSLPWIGHVLFAVPQSWRRAWTHNDERERFLWIWLFVDLAILSLSSNKHPNYLLAAMPVMTLLASQAFARGLARIHREQIKIPQLAVSIVALAAVVAGIAFGVVGSAKWPTVQMGIRGASAVFVCGVIATWWCWRRGQRSLAGWASFASAMGVFLFVVTFVTPQLDRRRDAVEFARQLRQEVLKDRPVCAYLRSGVLPGFHPSIYYLDEPVFQVRTFSELLQQVQETGELFAVVERVTLPRLEAVHAAVDFEEITQPSFPAGSRETPLVCVRLRSLHARNREDTVRRIALQKRD